MTVDVVIPSIGRPTLGLLLESLASERGPIGRVIVVDDRPGGRPLEVPGWAEVVRGRARGPASARNRGWRTSGADWVAFLDDDVLVATGWSGDLADDIEHARADVAGTQGAVRVPRPAGRRPTDWERHVAGLEGARYATADMAFRRAALEDVGGFDERFRRAYREDSDLALRLLRRSWRLERGSRSVVHPVPPADRWVSVRLQAGNRDDALMRRLHGPGWRAEVGAPRGRLRRHLVVTCAGAFALAAGLAGRRRAAAGAAAVWAAGTLELAGARIAPGPRTGSEVATMLATSVLIPPVAAARAVQGRLGARPQPWPLRLRAVLFDRDGTLVENVHYNGSPDLVRPADGAREALDRLRAAGVRTAVVTNQSGIARGLLTPGQVSSVNRRIDELLGPMGEWLVCPHGPWDGCECRKPAPGLVLDAARRLGVDPASCAVIGDTGADVEAAAAAGARSVLVPNAATRPEEIAEAPRVAGDLIAAVDSLLGGAA